MTHRAPPTEPTAAAPPLARRGGRRWLLALAVLLGLLAGGVGLLVSRLPDGPTLARQAEAEFEKRFGIGLEIGSAEWRWQPVPRLVLEDVRTRQPQPITLARISVTPQWRLLWQREIGLARLEVDEVRLPSASVRAFRGRETRADDPPADGRWHPAPVPVERFVFRDLRWVDRRGIELDYAGQIDFDPGWLPRAAEIRRPEVAPPVALRLRREDAPAQASAAATHAWQVQADAGGGGWQGRAQLQQEEEGGALRLDADLQLREVDVAQLVAAFGRKPALEGRASGRTTLQARGERPGELLRSLRTRTQFHIAPATLLRFDLARTVRTLGRERAGQTVLDELEGTLQTQATGEGTRLRYHDLQARSGVLTAQGRLQVFNRRMQGRLAIDLVDGVVGVPLQLSGTLDSPHIGLGSGALAGAAAGTAVLPGVGTALGARLGQQLEDWFGDEEDEGGAPAPPRPAHPPADKPRARP
ncbi:AsmA-like C-terminal region-containing protein [Xenophilus sp. Marseille-Q4582]|uniref:AsmA-like C-terminal region-containing protein n=1 Tax=Xenophilus sp. Marseille-Q4582 TaxID=2866600 RepID=UPI001CE4649F|nr:AsmA-like C-terminal region-containing protein [Xenophilus sp. Marseille-Q4582]